jgi:hypothetical protein
MYTKVESDRLKNKKSYGGLTCFLNRKCDLSFPFVVNPSSLRRTVQMHVFLVMLSLARVTVTHSRDRVSTVYFLTLRWYFTGFCTVIDRYPPSHRSRLGTCQPQLTVKLTRGPFLTLPPTAGCTWMGVLLCGLLLSRSRQAQGAYSFQQP